MKLWVWTQILVVMYLIGTWALMYGCLDKAIEAPSVLYDTGTPIEITQDQIYVYPDKNPRW